LRRAGNDADEAITEVLASTEGTYRVAAAKTRGGQMYRIG